MGKHATKTLLCIVVVVVSFLGLWPPYDPDGPRQPGPDGVLGTADDTGVREGKLKRGIDLSGGTILVYQIRKDTATSAELHPEKFVAAILKRINPTGTLDVAVRAVGPDRIEVVLPQADPQTVEDVKRRITALGKLEFRILATDQETHPDKIRQALEKFPETGSPDLEWVEVADPEVLVAHPRAVFKQEGGRLFALTLVPEPSMTVTGDHLTRVRRTEDEHFRPAVGFEFNPEGAYRFGLLTGKFSPKPTGAEWALAIILDGKIMSAPIIRSKITSSGQITGNFTERDVANLIAILDAGQLPATLFPEPISEDTIGPTLGQDTIRMGQIAIAVSMVVVPLFMLSYYRFAGLVANIALLVNMLMILGAMGWVDATFTLPGLAGLALTVGMAVDANVLVFERIREERAKGASLGLAIKNGFSRAWITILDSNVTTIITAWILYVIGTDQIRGFGLTLMIGLVANLFTAVFMSRLIFDICYERRWIRQLKMMQLIGTPNVDFLAYRKVAYVASSVIIGLGLIAAVARGRDLLDIEFTGGTAVSFKLAEPMSSAEVRRLATAHPALTDVRVEVLRDLGQASADLADRYLIRTTNRNVDDVKKAILEQFGDRLARVTVHRTEVQTPEKSESDQKATGAAGATSPRRVVQLELLSFGPVSETFVRRHLNDVLEAQGVSNPLLHYQLRLVQTRPLLEPAPEARRAGGDTLTAFELRMDRDPMVVLEQLRQRIEADNVAFERVETFGSQVAGEARIQALVATVLSWVTIAVYLAFRFRNFAFGMAAVLALVHDVLVTFGFIAISGYLVYIPLLERFLLLDPFKVDLSIVAALLTIVGYSVNDTIVVFDRIRELRGRAPTITPAMVNAAVNQTLARTILTAGTVLAVALILYIFGGPGIHGFAFAMVIGTITGSYSTIFIAGASLFFIPGFKFAPAPIAPTPAQRPVRAGA
jgi:SecD/SecF fusion protein